MSNYPRKDLVVSVLVEVAKRAAAESSATHPGDIATAMTFAIESAAETIDVINNEGVFSAIAFPDPPF